MFYRDKDVSFYLHYPLCDLLADAYSASFFNKLADSYAQDCVGQEINGIIKSLEWALANEGFDFKKLIPGIELSNNEILLFFERYLIVLKSNFDERDLLKMRIPEDERDLKILIVNDDFVLGINSGSFTDTRYKVKMTSQILDAVQINKSETQDLLILSLDSPDEIYQSVATFHGISKSHIPTLLLLKQQTDVNVEKLYKLGCSQHLFLPIPRYLLLQEVYKLTSR